MRLKVLGSGSSGNCYVLTSDDGDVLIIEAGVKFSEVKKYLNFSFNKIVGVLVSHSHLDHAKYISDFIAFGVNVYTGQETIDALKIKSHRLNPLTLQKGQLIGKFKVLPVPMKHDVPCLAFVINHNESGNIVFITDTYYSPWKFANIHNWIIECNYSQEILDGKQGYGDTNKFLRNRVLSSHLSLENNLELFRVNDLTKTNNIVLTHLSDTNSNEKHFKEVVENQTLKKVTVATKNVELEFNKTPF
jgi:phosphoribosyl 1,2-cyclic phosphodiesterase